LNARLAIVVASAVISAFPRRGPGAGRETAGRILRAAVEVIARHSLSGTTVERVAEAAGVAPGTVILHFKRKEALLVAVLEHLAQEFDEARRAAVEGAAADPVAALRALIEVAFDPRVSDPAKVAVWNAFWGEAGARAVYQERAGAVDQRYQADLLRICRSLVERGGHAHIDAEAVALGFAGLVEHLWQEILVGGADFDRDRARCLARAYLTSFFPGEFGGAS
jgi:TetR/AcrR family transcriptional repressor of bet genes